MGFLDVQYQMINNNNTVQEIKQSLKVAQNRYNLISSRHLITLHEAEYCLLTYYHVSHKINTKCIFYIVKKSYLNVYSVFSVVRGVWYILPHYNKILILSFWSL